MPLPPVPPSVSRRRHSYPLRRDSFSCGGFSRAVSQVFWPTPPLATWLVPEDRQVPTVLSQRTLRQVLGLSFTMLANTRGVGPTRLDGLLAVLERAVEALRGAGPSRRNETASPAAGRHQYDRLVPNMLQLPIAFRDDCGTSSAYAQDVTNDVDIDDEQWEFFCQRIRHHRIELLNVNVLPAALRDVASWTEGTLCKRGCTATLEHSVTARQIAASFCEFAVCRRDAPHVC